MGARAPLIDAYQVLGVARDAGQDELKSAHRRLVRQHHPDLVPPDRRAEATRLVQEINVAYGLVRDPDSRAAYDRLYAAQRRHDAVATADQELALRWQELLGRAGRWAGAWWARNRRPLERSAVRAALGARRAGRELFARLLWVVYCVVGLWVGVAVALSAGQVFLGGLGAASPVAGAIVGWFIGSDRGRRRRHRLARLPPPARPPYVVPAFAVAALAAALGLDRVL
jgi:hypothetical protein